MGLADQSFNGNRLKMDADKDSYIAMSTDDTLDVVLGNAGTLNVAGGIGILTLLGSDSTATEGPSFEMRRDSATPAANDVLGVSYVRGTGCQRHPAACLQDPYLLDLGDGRRSCRNHGICSGWRRRTADDHAIAAERGYLAVRDRPVYRRQGIQRS